jgi:hypothetical protein
LQGFTLAGKRPYTARLVLADPDGKTRLTRQLTLRGV